MELYVQFTDDTETTICSYFTLPQNPDEWPHQGIVDTDDKRWATYWNAQPPFNREYLPQPT